jgi:hypothetical protein
MFGAQQIEFSWPCASRVALGADGHFEGINLSVLLGYLDSYLIRRYVGRLKGRVGDMSKEGRFPLSENA